MIFRTGLLCLVLFCLDASAQIFVCPDDFPEECDCNDNGNGVRIECIRVPLQVWNLRQTFDEVSDLISFNLVSLHINGAMVQQQQEIPAYSISAPLKTTQFSIWAAEKFTRIDPNAFNGSYSFAEIFEVADMHFSDPQEAFDLVNNFKQVQRIYIEPLFYENTLSAIPANALSADLGQLLSVTITNSKLESIGDFAFAGPPQLESILLSDNNLKLANISDTAFNLTKTDNLYLVMERNPGITYLPEEKFRNIVTGHRNVILVGPGYSGSQADHLRCDERMNWFCEAGVASVDGYLCKETQYTDIYDYCEQTFGVNLLANRDQEYLKKMEVIDHLRRKTAPKLQ